MSLVVQTYEGIVRSRAWFDLQRPPTMPAARSAANNDAQGLRGACAYDGCHPDCKYAVHSTIRASNTKKIGSSTRGSIRMTAARGGRERARLARGLVTDGCKLRSRKDTLPRLEASRVVPCAAACG